MDITANDAGLTRPSGYTPVGVYRWNTGANAVLVRGIAVTSTGTNNLAWLYNAGSSAASGTFSCGILFVKSSFVET